jgi:hypothetical protein
LFDAALVRAHSVSMYKIIGADQKQYGPISADQIRQWISEGRVNGDTVACAEGSDDWKPLSQFPEFGFTAPAAPTPGASGPVTREEIIARDYSIDIMSCFSRAWKLFTTNFGTMFVTFLLFVALAVAVSFVVQIVFAAAGFNHLPFATKQYLGPIYVIFNTLVIGPGIGGVFYVYLSTMRGKPAGAGELFTGFKSFQDLFLGKLIPSLVGTVCMLPYTIANASKTAPFFDRLQENPHSANFQEIFSQFVSGFTASLPIFFLCLVPSLYFYLNWSFTLPLIIDKQMDFWTAMRTSWKMVHKHWFHIFGLLVLAGLLNVVGAVACCVGLLFTVPLGMTAICYAYEDIFGRQNTHSGQGA